MLGFTAATSPASATAPGPGFAEIDQERRLVAVLARDRVPLVATRS
jgi:hypothetical protein